MKYKVIDIYSANNKTAIWLDKKPIVDDLGSSKAVLELQNLDVEYVHPDGFILVNKIIDADDLIGKSIVLL